MSPFVTTLALLLLTMISTAQAFAPPPAMVSAALANLPATTASSLPTAASVTFSSLMTCSLDAALLSSSSSSSFLSSGIMAYTYTPSSSLSSPTLVLAAATLDPTTFLSDVLGGLIGTPLILAVPIVVALAIASLVAFLIISYANPEVEDDE